MLLVILLRAQDVTQVDGLFPGQVVVRLRGQLSLRM